MRLCANVWHFKPCHKFFDSLNFTGPDSCSRVISFSSLMSSFPDRHVEQFTVKASKSGKACSQDLLDPVRSSLLTSES